MKNVMRDKINNVVIKIIKESTVLVFIIDHRYQYAN